MQQVVIRIRRFDDDDDDDDMTVTSPRRGIESPSRTMYVSVHSMNGINFNSISNCTTRGWVAFFVTRFNH